MTSRRAQGFSSKSSKNKHIHKSSREDLGKAIDEFQKGNLIKAKELCTAISSKLPNDGMTLGLLATIEKQLGNLETSQKLFEKTLFLCPDNPEFHHNYAGLLLSIDLKKALECSEIANKLSPNQPLFLERLGYIQFRLHDRAGGLKTLLRAIELNPNLVDARISLGGILNELGNPSEAVNITLKAIQINPSCVEAYINLGTFLLEQGNADKALEFMLSAIRIKPNSAEANRGLAMVYKKQNKLKQALLSSRKAIELSPDCSASHYTMGTIQEALGQLKEGRASLEAAIRLNPKEAGALFELSKSIESKEDAQKVLELAQALIEPEPTPRDASLLYFALANCLHKLNDFKQAASYLSRANQAKLTFMPSNASKLIRMIHIYRQKDLGQPATLSLGKHKKIFIIGMPRCGSTLLETVLSMNPIAKDYGESHALQLAVNAFEKQASLGENKATLEDLYEKYIESTQASEHEYTIDKQLHNFVYTGIIASYMPDAKVIHCYRNPYDNILSMYRANLTQGANYTSCIADASRILMEHHNAISYYKSIYPNNIYSFDYDHFVESPSLALQPLIEWLGWEWTDHYLHPELSKRSINTASVIQARRPISNSSIGGWKNYSDLLKPAQDILSGWTR